MADLLLIGGEKTIPHKGIGLDRTLLEALNNVTLKEIPCYYSVSYEPYDD